MQIFAPSQWTEAADPCSQIREKLEETEEITIKCPSCTLYNQTPLPAGRNLRVPKEMKSGRWMCFVLQNWKTKVYTPYHDTHLCFSWKSENVWCWGCGFVYLDLFPKKEAINIIKTNKAQS